jgi:small subunit ribosomal protein S16
VLKIRLNRMGAKKRPFYRIVAIDSHKARGGKFVEVLGTYNSIEKPAQITLDEEKIFVRLDQGAELSETVASIFKKSGLMKKYLMAKKGEDVTEIKLSDTLKDKQKKKKKKTAKAE